ncbi:MAG: TonB-dependent receptor [Prolixibacteraceae bacterium]|nr:TonB-dependent receptor [Prolixibacteraceae bacterium]
MKFKSNLMRIVLVIIAIAFATVTYAQKKTVTGVVTDKGTSEPLPGVTVVVEGTTLGTVTDIDGNFSVNVPGEDAFLSFSYIGYTPQKLPVKGVSKLTIELEQDLMDLGEVVVVGYGVSKKSDLTGAVGSVKEEDFNRTTAATPEQLIQGRIAGVQITQNNGEPGAGAQIRIRGASTIRSSQQPLYVIDGVPLDMSTTSPDGVSAAGMGGAPATNPLNFINPNDIESFDILKDASATAIYGSRGANGVILITTKKGKEGKSNIEYSAYMSVSQLPRKLDVLSASEWLALRIDSLGIDEGNENHYGYETDWQDEIFRTAVSQSHSLSLSGGSKNNSYRVSFNYLDQNGIIEKSSLKKYVSRLNLTQHAFNDRLLLEANVTASQIMENRVPVGALGFEGDLLLNALKTNPTWPVYDSTGVPFQTISAEERNPIAMLEYTDDLTRTTRILGGGAATVNIFTGLKYKANFGIDYTNAIRKIAQSQELSYMRAEQGRAQINTKELMNYVIEHIVSYNKTFGKHTIDALAGYSFQHIERTGYNQQAGYFTTDKIDYINQMQEGDPAYRQISSWANTPEELQSFFGRINYNLDEKYLVTATFRRDGSSKFGANRKYGNFPSIAAGWRMSQEEFIKNLNVFNNLKLRLGWGMTGNSEIGADNSTFLLKPDAGATAIINNVPITGFKIDKTPQPDLHWETTTSTNIGLDFGFFDGRLSGSVDLFRKLTTDLLVEQPTKALSPTSTFVSNIEDGYIKNDGIELGLNGIIVNTKNVNWTVNFNCTSIKNTAVDILDDDASIIPTGQVRGQGLTGAYAQAYANNRTMASFYMLVFDSIDHRGRIQYLKKESGGDSLMFLGSALPSFTWGLNNTIRIKNFDISFFIDGVHGNKIFNNTALLLDKTNLKQSKNSLRQYAYDEAGYTNSTKVSDRYLEDGSYVRLSNVSIGYTFDVKKISWIENLKVFASGSNLLLFTKYSGYDPDVSSSADMNGVRSLGIDITNYPKARTFMFGLNVTF